ncbi:MAG: hypothetical protein N5P05_003401 [Chroococcopsis gigantea SAG 12.99]|jgi:hypothetical protein|nr:DUF2808 domain-containing protein [Chlorogloea purpurea SAG 13.99]MDV3001795.1 hypothetical protein [Chroococcopsis gigantea SAG 12.99]
MRFLPTLTLLLCLSTSRVGAVQLADGTSAFTRSPRLLDFMTTMSSVSVWGAKYYLTIDFPAGAQEGLQSVAIQQKQGTEDIQFDLQKTFAFFGDRDNRQEAIPIREVTRDDGGNISIVFERAIDSGRTVTIGLVPYQNPFYDGVYLFGVTAFPTGDKPRGLYLGVGRLQFYRGGSAW